MAEAKRRILSGGELIDSPGHWKITMSVEGEEREWSVLRKPEGTYWEIVGVDIFPRSGGIVRIDIGDQIVGENLAAECESYYEQLRESSQRKNKAAAAMPSDLEQQIAGDGGQTKERISLTLIASNDDPSWRSGEYQASLGEVERALRALDKNISVLAFFQESVDASSFLKGGFTIAKSIGLAAVPIIGAWLHGRAGRKVRLKVGDIEAEAHSVSEVEELLKLADEVRPRVTE